MPFLFHRDVLRRNKEWLKILSVLLGKSLPNPKRVMFASFFFKKRKREIEWCVFYSFSEGPGPKMF